MNKPSEKSDASKYMYVGSETPYLKGVFYQKLKSPFNEGDEWKNDGQNFVFAMSLERHMQHELKHKYFSSVDFGPMDDISAVEVSQNKGEVGGYLWMGTPEKFAEDFEKLGK